MFVRGWSTVPALGMQRLARPLAREHLRLLTRVHRVPGLWLGPHRGNWCWHDGGASW